MVTISQNPVLNPLERLQTYNHSQLLDVIDRLRAQGLSHFLPLPQLIVCGDQSSGKSSVLEAICGVPFPKKDNLCTRFATEVILRRNVDIEEIEAHVSIRPGQDRSETDKQNLENFAQTLPDVQDLPKAIQTAKDAMGLGSQGSNAFSTDVLRLEITGRTMPQLTIVDLPGLIHSENKFQTAQDVDMVTDLVKSYMVQSRSIILAVITAKNDYANQIVLKRAREVDPTGQRILGIITKPDTLHTGSDSERAFIELARNTDVVFKLGWHVVRNFDTNDSSQEDQSRDHLEESFFQHSNWRVLGNSSLGINSLRNRLSEVLFGQITRELPHLTEEIQIQKDDCQSALDRLGRSRDSEEDQRLFLTELNQKVYDICRAGCDGNYDDGFFRETDGSLQPIEFRRIRATIQNQSMNFKRKLESSGSRWQLSERSEPSKGKLTREETIERVVDLLKRSRGRELPGTYNPLLISELFHEYSGPWEGMSKQFVAEIWQSATQFLDAVLRHLTDKTVFETYTRLVIGPAMDGVLLKANKALAVLLKERACHAVTYNHDLIKDIAAHQNERRMSFLEDKLSAFFVRGDLSVKGSQISGLLRSLVEEPEPDMDRAAAEDIFEKMLAYYKVALGRLIDNIPIHVIENVVVRELQTVVRPVGAWKMDRQLVEDIAGESPAMKSHREQLTHKLETLTKGETICKRYTVQPESALDTPQDSELGSPVEVVKALNSPSIAPPKTSKRPEKIPPEPLIDELLVSVPEAVEKQIVDDQWAVPSTSYRKKKSKKRSSVLFDDDLQEYAQEAIPEAAPEAKLEDD